MTGTTRDLPFRLTTAELADFWRVSKRTIERRIHMIRGAKIMLDSDLA